MSRRVLLATRSRHKAAEIQRLVKPASSIELITLQNLGIQESSAEDDLENEPTFVGNARAKALFFAHLTGVETLGDDSGLEVIALNLAPGVRTRRFALDAGQCELTGAALDAANLELTLQRMQSFPAGQRAARYVCACALASPGGELVTSVGTCSGEIAFERRGTGGFGYDPIFLIPGLGRTFAELTPDQKDDLSHRARACRALLSLIR